MRRPTAPEGRAPEAADSASSDDVAGDTDTYTDSEEEIEAPGYAQFVDDESEEVASASSSDDEAALQKEIESVPFAQLLKARRAVRTSARPANEAVSQDTLHERREAAKAHLRAMDTTKPAPQRRPDTRTHTPLGTREHKTAPAVMPTRRPVSRKRQVVETVQHSRQRDPRFDSLSAGPVNLDLLGKSYNFLPSLYDNELASLRTAYDKLKRLEARHAGPHAKSEQALRIREERANAELALRRAESQRSERLQQQNKRSVQSDIKKENQRRVDAGLRPYFPKKGTFLSPTHRSGTVRRRAAPQVRSACPGKGQTSRRPVCRREEGDGEKGTQGRTERQKVFGRRVGRRVAYRSRGAWPPPRRHPPAAARRTAAQTQPPWISSVGGGFSDGHGRCCLQRPPDHEAGPCDP